MLICSAISLEVSMRFSVNFLIYLVAGASLAGGPIGGVFPKPGEEPHDIYKFSLINMGWSDREVRVLPLPPIYSRVQNLLSREE